VRRQCQPVYRGVTFQGATEAKPSNGMRDALSRASAIVITPSNPFVSIDPILALAGVRDAIQGAPCPVVAISPIIGGKAVKGPLAKMMAEQGLELSAAGIARHYGSLIDGWIIDQVDRELAPLIEAMGCRARVCNTMMNTLDDKRRLAGEALDFGRQLARSPVC